MLTEEIARRGERVAKQVSASVDQEAADHCPPKQKSNEGDAFHNVDDSAHISKDSDLFLRVVEDTPLDTPLTLAVIESGIIECLVALVARSRGGRHRTARAIMRKNDAGSNNAEAHEWATRPNVGQTKFKLSPCRIDFTVSSGHYVARRMAYDVNDCVHDEMPLANEAPGHARSTVPNAAAKSPLLARNKQPSRPLEHGRSGILTS
jgi:hypothetical protein